MNREAYPPLPEALDRSIFSAGNVERIIGGFFLLGIGRMTSSRLWIIGPSVRRAFEITHLQKFNCRRRDGTVTFQSHKQHPITTTNRLLRFIPNFEFTLPKSYFVLSLTPENSGEKDFRVRKRAQSSAFAYIEFFFF